MDPVQLARLLALARAGIGGALLVAPRLVAAWIGPSARRPEVRAVSRSLAARDLAIGLLTLQAVDSGDRARARSLVRVAAATDATDALVTVVAFRHLPRPGRLLMAGLAAGGAVLGWQAGRSLS